MADSVLDEYVELVRALKEISWKLYPDVLPSARLRDIRIDMDRLIRKYERRISVIGDND